VTRRTTALQHEEAGSEDDRNGLGHAGGKQNAAAIPPAARYLTASVVGRVEPAAPLDQKRRIKKYYAIIRRMRYRLCRISFCPARSVV
jgi:hypothetical protein